MKEYFHVDMSTRFSQKGNTGIACLRLPSKKHKGCALNNRVKRYIDRTLLGNESKKEQYAKLYAICIYVLVKDDINDIEKLVICNDEEFPLTKNYLEKLLGKISITFDIINITEFRKQFSRKVQSPADNYARHYAKRALKIQKWHKGTPLDVIPLTYSMIKQLWERLKEE